MSGLPTDIILDILLLAKVTVEHRDIVDNTSDKQKKHHAIWSSQDKQEIIQLKKCI